MRIVLAIHHGLDPNSGVSGVTLQLGETYSRKGHHVAFASHDDLPTWVSPRFKQLLFPLYLFCRFAVSTMVGGWDVIDASTGDGWLLALIPRRLRRSVLVCRSHGLEHVSAEVRRNQMAALGITPTQKDIWYWWRYVLRTIAFSLRNSDRAFVLNSYDRDYAIRRLRCDPRRVKVVANGLSDPFLRAAKTHCSETKRPTHLCFVGSWIARKGTEDLVRIFEAVRAVHPQVTLSVLGTGVDETQVLSSFPEGCRSAVRVVPAYKNEQLPDLLGDAAVLLFPSASEGYGMAVVEAIACGLIPVSYTIPGPTTIIDSAQVGSLVPYRDVEAFVGATCSLISLGHADRQRLSSVGRKWAAEQTWTRIAGEQLLAYALVSGAQ